MSEDKKYELIPDKDSGLFRVKALRDIPRYYVKAGNLGGLVSGERNLSQRGDCWVGRGAKVLDNACVLNDAYVGDWATVMNNAYVCENATVCGVAVISGKAVISGQCRVGATAKVHDTKLLGKVKVYFYSRISGDFCLNKIVHMKCGADITSPDHVLTLDSVASEHCKAELYRTKEGYTLAIGCWTGTVQQLHALADSDNWPSECDKATREKYRPQLHAVADLCAAQIRLWGDRDV